MLSASDRTGYVCPDITNLSAWVAVVVRMLVTWLSNACTEAPLPPKVPAIYFIVCPQAVHRLSSIPSCFEARHSGFDVVMCRVASDTLKSDLTGQSVATETHL